MISDKEQDCMRVCYQHWENNSEEPQNAEDMSVITYAMLLAIISNSEDNSDMDHHIERARTLYQQGLQHGWMLTH